MSSNSELAQHEEAHVLLSNSLARHHLERQSGQQRGQRSPGLGAALPTAASQVPKQEGCVRTTLTQGVGQLHGTTSNKTTCP
jgi:hypothetical protein